MQYIGTVTGSTRAHLLSQRLLQRFTALNLQRRRPPRSVAPHLTAPIVSQRQLAINSGGIPGSEFLVDVGCTPDVGLVDKT